MDIETINYSISIPYNIGISQTAYLPSKLKLCVGARVILTDNINVPDRFIISSMDSVRHSADQNHFIVNFPFLER